MGKNRKASERNDQQNAEELRMTAQRMSSHLSNSPMGVIEWDKNMIIQSWSTQAEAIFGWSTEEVIGKHFNDVDLVFAADATEIAIVASELMSGAVDRNRIVNRNNAKSGKVIYCEWFNSVLKDEKGTIQSILSLVKDVTEAKKSSLQLKGENEVFEMIVADKPLYEVLNTVSLNFEAITDDSICSILLLDESQSYIKHGAGPSLPALFNSSIEGEPIGPVAGSCGTAAFRKERVIVSDIANDPLWINYKELALSFGLKAAWSTPIINNDGKVYGTFAIYYTECRTPLEAELVLVDRAVNHVRMLFDRIDRIAKNKESEERYRLLFENSGEAIFEAMPDGTILSANPAACELFGRTEADICSIGRSGTVNPNDPRLAEAIEKRKQDSIVKTELTFVRKDGTNFEAEVTSSVFISAKGESRSSIILRDISERKKAEQALIESEERLRLSTELAKVAVWEYNMITNTMSRSRNHDRLYGLDWQPIWDINTFLNSTHPDDRDISSEIIQKAAAPGGDNQYQFDFRTVHPDESIHWLSVVGQVVERDADGAGFIIRGSLIDITEKKEAEIELSEQEQLLRLIVENSPSAIAMFDKDMKYIIVSNRYLIDFNLEDKAIIGKSHYEVFPEIPQDFKDVHNRCLNGATEKRDEDKIVRADGHVRWMNWEIQPWYTMNNDIGGIILFSEAITERKNAEEKLIKSELNYRSLFEQASDTIFIVGPNFRYIDINESGCKLTGYTKEEFVKLTPLDLIFDEELEQNSITLEALETMEIVQYESRLKKKDGGAVATEVTAKMLDDRRVIVFIRDITERKRTAQEILLKNEELSALTEHLNDVREDERMEISRDIHDELGQLLACIKIDAKWLSKRISGDSEMSPKMDEMLQLIDDSISQIRKIATELRPEILDNLGLVNTIEWKAEKFFKRTGIPCTLHIECSEVNVSPRISVNIFRIIQESLFNISKHAEATEVKIQLKLENEQSIFLVSDNGKGIDFEANKARKSFGIIGMRERATIIGGQLQIRANKGKGTTIELKVPVEQENRGVK